jgi:uncharacterized protein (TIGR03083 family)
MTDEDLVTTLASTWASIGALIDDIDEKLWNESTDCPGWTVKDQISHLIGFERKWFLDQPSPELSTPKKRYVHNELGEDNEAWVADRRSATPEMLRTEFGLVVKVRLAQLNAVRDLSDGFDTAVTTFRGNEPMRDALATRLFDIWVHEQDIRRAVKRPGNYDGPAMLHARDRMLDSLPWVAAKRAKLPDGSVIGIALYGSEQLLRTIRVVEGRGETVQAADHRPAAAVTMHEETFLLATTGRKDPAELLEQGKFSLRGDAELAKPMALALRTVLL